MYPNSFYCLIAVHTDPDINVEIQYEVPKAGPCEDVAQFNGIILEILEKCNILNRQYFISVSQHCSVFNYCKLVNQQKQGYILDKFEQVCGGRRWAS